MHTSVRRHRSSLPQPAVLVLALASACADAPPPDAAVGGRVRIALAPLELPGVAFACFDLEVRNDLEQVVWRAGERPHTRAEGDEATVCTDAFGIATSGLTYVGACDATDADASDAGNAVNTVTVWVDGLYDGSGQALTGWRDPCSDGCAIATACAADADAHAAFDLTFLRSADQGFIDVGVGFADIFCSAKVDCVDALLEDPATAARGPTVVLGLACTAGAGDVPTTLYADPIDVLCDGGEAYHIAPVGPSGNLGGQAPGLFEVATYTGSETLPDVDTCYWTTAIGLDLETDADATRLGASCRLRTRLTAAEVPFEVSPGGFTSPARAAYPVIEVDVALTDANGSPTCGANALDAPGSGVTTRYTDPAAASGESFAFGLTCGALPAGPGPVCTPASCPDDGDPCNGREVCDATRGGCVVEPVTDGAACDTGACAVGSCVDGACVARPASQGSELCNAGWTFLVDSCVRVTEAARDWRAAVVECLQLPWAHLAALSSTEEQAAFTGLCSDGEAWLGARDASGDGGWEWVVGEAFDASAWAAGEPSLGSCMTVASDGAWHTRACGPEASAPAYVCEMAPLPCLQGWATTTVPAEGGGGADASFGQAIARLGARAVVGAPRTRANIGNATSPRRGAIHLLALDGATHTWGEVLKVLGPVTPDTSFGDAVGLGVDDVVVGAPTAPLFGVDRAGAAFVLARIGAAGLGEAIQLFQPDPSDTARFGDAVAIHGDLVAVGAPSAPAAGVARAGAVYLFARSGATWSFVAKLVASDASSGAGFGTVLALEADALFVGAPGDDEGATDSGKVYVFRRTAGVWVEAEQMQASPPQPSARFGSDLARAGDDLLVGAPGAVDAFPHGVAFVFVRAAGGWEQQAALVPSIDLPAPHFGTTVGLWNGEAIVADPTEGFAAMFRRDPFGAWHEVYQFGSGGGYMTALAFREGDALVGAPGVNSVRYYPLDPTCRYRPTP